MERVKRSSSLATVVCQRIPDPDIGLVGFEAEYVSRDQG